MSSASDTCGICEAQNIWVLAVEFCQDCEDSLCKECLEHHTISNSTKYHNTISIENYQELPQFIRDIKQQCRDHNEIYQNYCINHDVPLCKNCVITTHKHCKDTTTLDAIISNTKSSVALDFLECRIADVHLNVQSILKERKENLNMVLDEENYIQEQISNDRTVVNELFDKLEHQIKLESETIKNRLENVIKDFERKDTTLKHIRDYFSKIKMYASEIQVFLGMKEIEKQVQIDEGNIESLVTDGGLKQLNLQYNKNTKMQIEYADIGQVKVVENPSTVRIVRREVQQAQNVRQNNIQFTQNAKQPNHENYWAQFSYQARVEDELTIDKGEILSILDDSDPDWWRVRKYDSNKEIVLDGLVPANYLKRDDLYLYEWFFGMASKTERDKIILAHGKITGSFMVTESKKETYLLSVLHRDINTGDCHVHEYSINHNSSGYYLNTNLIFSDVPKLIAYYSCNTDVLFEKLTEPLGIAIRKPFPLESVEVNTLVHFGRYKDIWQGTLNKSVQVAVAAFKTGPGTKIALASEMYVLRQCRHDRIIKLYGVCSLNKQIYIVTELAAKGNLLNFLRHHEGQTFTFPRLIEIASQIADGMSYLEKKKCVHRYLAAKHILLVDDKNIKITDFQLTIQDECYHAANDKNHVKWMAQEAAFLGTFSTKSDVWSFGIVLVELISHGQVPYTGVSNNEIIEMIQKTDYRHQKPKNCSEPLYKIMTNCWKKQPEARPTFDYLYSLFDDYFVSVEPYYEVIDEDL